MYIDNYNIENWGSTWSKGKEKKNQLIGSIKGNDIDIKRLIRGSWTNKKKNKNSLLKD